MLRNTTRDMEIMLTKVPSNRLVKVDWDRKEIVVKFSADKNAVHSFADGSTPYRLESR